MVKAKKFVLAEKFEGQPKKSNLRLETEDLPDLKDGGKSHYLNIIKIVCYNYLM